MHAHRTVSSLTLALLSATFLTPPGPARAAPGAALGPEFQVNTFTTDEQRRPAVAMDADGDFVVTWGSFGQDGYFDGVFAQRFDAAGVAQGSELQVNTHTTFNQQHPAVAIDADGDFVVAWRSAGQDGDLYGIFAQRYNAAGVAQGSEFQVNTFTTGNQYAPAVAMDADGDFVVAWRSYGQDGSNAGIFARRYNAAGGAQDVVEFQVNTVTTSAQDFPAVAMDADGDFVVVWESLYQDGDLFGIFGQRFDAAGVPQGSEFQVNSVTTGSQGRPSAAMGADGDFVVTWRSNGQDGSGYGVFARRYNALGEAQGDEFQVNSFTTGNQSEPSVAMDADGDFVVTWQSSGQDGYGYGVFAQRFNAAGMVQGPEVQVNTFTTKDQQNPAVAMDADGDYVVTWQSVQDDYVPYYGGYSDGIFAQRFQSAESVPYDFTGDGRADIPWRSVGTGSMILWQMNGFTKEVTGSIGGASTVWQVVGIADFNADTKADILWHHDVNGATVIWQMDGFTKTDASGIGTPPPAWQVVGTGDFDGDSQADILWRHTTTGAALIWLMSGFTKLDSGGIGTVPLAWEVAGTGDFDGDAKSDILWRNTSTGAALIWRMSGFTKLASGGVGTVPLAWQVAGVGDFDDDAKSDILWHNTSTGSTVIWKMENLVKTAASGIGKPPVVWDLEGVGDTDGDRKADIVWRNSSTGNTLIWKMNGFVVDAVGGIGSVPLVWEVQ